MPDYDFKALSSYDFELLSRDLLQADLGIRLESFSQGADCGIDFRNRDNHTNLIVQCKHYADSGFARLTSALRRKERQKIDALAPSRYILTTSVSLTPPRKEKLIEILTPHCVNSSDILGREDLNNLLNQHPEIERGHFKLWLTSETVLRRVLDAGIFADTDAHLDRVRQRLSRYVQNASFDRARELLDRSHYCIIAGIPGIGKTTLAEVLLADLVDRQGFEALRISHDLAEIRPGKNTKRKQVFYFDDFLGKTSLEMLHKNEDQRLVELMEDVASNPNWRFILTTREYILNSARLHYEALAQPPVDFTLCVINLEDYVRSIRARILYNHIYFSDLPTTYKVALLQNRGYENILEHRNYNPRVIEYMTQARHACTVAQSLYLSEFIECLEHPARIWDHAFRHQISEAARHLLLVLATLPDDVLLGDLEGAFWTFYRFRQKKFGFTTKSGNWDDALKQLDGSLIRTSRIGKDLVVGFHNTSIRDYVEDFLSNSDSDVADLINAAHFYEQYTTLWTGRRGRRYQGVESHRDIYLPQLRKHLYGLSASAVRHVNRDGEPLGFVHHAVSNERRALFVVRIATELKSKEGDQFVKAVLLGLKDHWNQGRADKEDLVRLVQALTEWGLSNEDESFMAAKECLLSGIQVIDDFRAIANFTTTYPGDVSSSDLEDLKKNFEKFASEYSVGWVDDDPDWLQQVASDIEFVGEKLEVDVRRFTQPLHKRASEIENERAETTPAENDGDRWDPTAKYEDDVEQMFQSLRVELELQPGGWRR